MRKKPQKNSEFIRSLSRHSLWRRQVYQWPKLSFLCFLCTFVVNSGFSALEWQTTSKNITVHPLQASAIIDFPFTNTGPDSITILELKPGCGCTSGSVEKKEYAPGESGVIHVTFNLEKRLGAQRKGISVKTSEDSKKSTTLYVSTSIPKTYAPSVKRLIWKSGEERKRKSCRITNAHKDPFRLVKSVPVRDGLEIELKPIREGYEYELIVQPTSTDLKNILIPITIHPEIPDGLDKTKTFTVYALLK